MKRTLLSGLMALPLFLAAQTLYFSDDIESYIPDTFLCVQTTDWIPWSQPPGGNQDVLVTTDNAAMGAQSVVVSSPGGNGPQDIVLLLGDQTAGQWSVQYYLLVDSANNGYFNFQKAEAPGTEWALECYLNSDGSGTLEVDGGTTNFVYTNGSWIHIELRVDLDADLAELWIGTDMIATWQWSLKANGDPGLNQLGGINFYAASTSGPALYYIDEVMVYGPDAFPGTSIEENNLPSFSFYPNPVVDVLNLTVENSHDSYFNVYDLTGKVIIQNISFTQNVGNSFIDVSTLNSGIYLLEMTDGQQRYTKRFVKK